jgi:lactoylglutathione lyase
MSDHDVRMVVLSTDDLDESIRFYSETLGMKLKFRDGAHYAALAGGSITLALATEVDHPLPGHVVVGIKTAEPSVMTTRETDWCSTARWVANLP